jgi:hypothetical protein
LAPPLSSVDTGVREWEGLVSTIGGRWLVYGAIRTYRVTDAEEISRRVRDEFVPMVRDVPGFVAYYVVDAGGGTISSITICEDRGGVEESTARAADWVSERIASLIESGPEIMTGEILVDHTRIGATT